MSKNCWLCGHELVSQSNTKSDSVSAPKKTAQKTEEVEVTEKFSVSEKNKIDASVDNQSIESESEQESGLTGYSVTTTSASLNQDQHTKLEYEKVTKKVTETKSLDAGKETKETEIKEVHEEIVRCPRLIRNNSGMVYCCRAYQKDFKVYCPNCFHKELTKEDFEKMKCSNSSCKGKLPHFTTTVYVVCPDHCKGVDKPFAEQMWYYRAPQIFRTDQGVKIRLYKSEEVFAEKVYGKIFVAYENPNDHKSRLLSAKEVWRDDRSEWSFVSLEAMRYFVSSFGCWRCHKPLELRVSGKFEKVANSATI